QKDRVPLGNGPDAEGLVDQALLAIGMGDGRGPGHGIARFLFGPSNPRRKLSDKLRLYVVVGIKKHNVLGPAVGVVIAPEPTLLKGGHSARVSSAGKAAVELVDDQHAVGLVSGGDTQAPAGIAGRGAGGVGRTVVHDDHARLSIGLIEGRPDRITHKLT